MTEINYNLKLLLANDPEINLEVLIPKVKALAETYLSDKNVSLRDSKIDVLNSGDIDNSWVIEQCLCVIEFINNLDITLLKKIKPNDLAIFTQDIIFDFQTLNQYLTELGLETIYSPNDPNAFPNISKSGYIDSMQAFTAAKMNAFNAGMNSYRTPEYKRKITPFMIRQAIELKIITQMLGIHDTLKIDANHNYKKKFITITQYIDFIEQEGSNLFDLPSVSTINDIRNINKWTNEFIHTGFNAFSWQVAKAISTIEPLFSIQKNGSIVTSGLDFRSENFTQTELENKLNNKFAKTKFLFIS